MKKSLLSLILLSVLAACSPNDHTSEGEHKAPPPEAAASEEKIDPAKAAKIEGDSLEIETARGQASVPAHVAPAKLAVFDWGALDDLNKLGITPAASTDKISLSYVQAQMKNSKVVGTLFEPDLEALNAFQPQLIIIGARSAKAFDQLYSLAPTIDMTPDVTDLRQSVKARLEAYGKIFNKAAEAKAAAEELDQSFADTKAAVQGKGNGLIVLVNGGKMSAFGVGSRFGWIHTELGVPPVDDKLKIGNHGNPISFEYIKDRNPDWLFVVDRTAAIGETGKAAQDVLNNPLVAETTAWKKGQVVYLAPEAYLALGGVQQLLNNNKQIKDAFDAAQ